MGVRELKHEALLREWSGRIAECRNSGKERQGVVCGTGNRDKDVLLLGETVCHRGKPAACASASPA